MSNDASLMFSLKQRLDRKKVYQAEEVKNNFKIKKSLLISESNEVKKLLLSPC